MQGEPETSPSATLERFRSFVVVTPLSGAPSLSFNFSLSPRTSYPGSPPPALLPSHGQWSWDGLKLEPQPIFHTSYLSQAIICWVDFLEGGSPRCLTWRTSLKTSHSLANTVFKTLPGRILKSNTNSHIYILHIKYIYFVYQSQVN